MSASKGDRVSVGDMKRALQNAGVDTSTCFERSDLEQKFVLLSDSEKKNVSDGETKSGSSSQSTRAESSSSTSSSSGASSSGASKETKKDTKESTSKDKKSEKKKDNPFEPQKLFDNVLSFARESANRLEVKWGVGAKLREQTKGFRQTIVNLDGQLGVSKFFKNTVPPAWGKLQEFRQTPLGRVCNFVFYIWLFASGFFWTLLSFGLTAVFLTNLLFPQFFAERAAKMQQDARARFAQQQGGMPGGMGGMGGPGMGGMGGPGMGGATRPPPGYGAPPGNSQSQGRTSYGSGSDGGAVFDVDADVKDM